MLTLAEEELLTERDKNVDDDRNDDEERNTQWTHDTHWTFERHSYYVLDELRTSYVRSILFVCLLDKILMLGTGSTCIFNQSNSCHKIV